jgi:hypothetical protein
MEQCLLTVKSQTSNISASITALMQHVQIPTACKYRKDNISHDTKCQKREDVEDAYLSTLSHKRLGENCF